MEEKKEKHYYPIFDRKGKASYFLDQDKIHIYSWEGRPVAMVDKGAVFTFKKKHLGWLDEGWLRDLSGKCVGFTEPGRGGPNPPKTRPPADPPAEKQGPPETPEIEEPTPLGAAILSTGTSRSTGPSGFSPKAIPSSR